MCCCTELWDWPSVLGEDAKGGLVSGGTLQDGSPWLTHAVLIFLSQEAGRDFGS